MFELLHGFKQGGEEYRDEVFGTVDMKYIDAAKGQRNNPRFHENEKGIYGDKAARCRDCRALNCPYVRAAFDPANFVQCEQGAARMP